MSSLPTPTHSESSRTRIVTSFGIALAGSFVLGVAIVIVSWFAAGPGLGVYFGTLLLASLVCPHMAALPTMDPRMKSGTGVPPVLSSQKHGRDARATGIFRPPLIPISLWLGITVGWCLSLNSPDVSIFNIVLCLIVLAAYLSAMTGVVSVMRRLGLSPILAGAVVAAGAIAWLTWPVWLSGLLSGPHGETIAGWLVPVDPLIAINSVLKQFGAWDHAYSIAYNHLTTLNQDAAYRMPTTIFPCVLFHGIIGLIGFATAGYISSAPTR